MLKKRDTTKTILISILTCNIYAIITLFQIGNETNKICEGDGKRTMNYIGAYFLAFVTLGIFPIIWGYNLMERLQDNAYRYGPKVDVPNSGSMYLLFLIPIVGPYIALHKVLQNINAYADIYGTVQPASYTTNAHERNEILTHFYDAASGSNAAPVNKVTPPQPPVYRQQNNIGAVPATEASRFPAIGNIKGFAGMYAGYDFPINNGQSIIIGTDPDQAEIVLTKGATKVSRKHCMVTYNSAKGTYTVCDYSTNGVLLENGEPLTKNTYVELDSKTIIYLADRTNGFRLG